MAVEMIALRIAREIREEREALAAHVPPTQPKKVPMTQNPKTVQGVKASKPSKSFTVLVVLAFLVLAVFLGVVATGIPALAPLAIVSGLAAATFAVLSLREI